MELLVYKASAGSGKTFTLAVQYIRHLILNPRAYRQILAVTFTNKATAEMKERILSQLYGICIAHPDSEAYLQVLKTMLPREMGDDEIRLRALQALTAMAHDYGRFRVETIDSFFQSVMRNLGRELELAPGLTIELDTKRVMADAVKSMMQKLTPTSPVLAWLLEYIGERIGQDKRWNVAKEVEHFGGNIFSEEYIERGEALRRCLAEPGYLKLYKDTLKALQEESLARMKGFAEEFDRRLEEGNVSVEELKRGRSGVAGYFNKLASGKLTDKDVVNASMLACMEDAGEWVTKSSKRRTAITSLAESELMPLLQEAEERRPLELATMNSCRLTLQHIGELQLLNHLADEVHTLNQEQNRFLLADTTALLHRLMGAGDASFIFEKMGATLRHVMIDEFQDTSRMQWDNFRILLDEGLSQGADSLIVGDVKQSIYRWRNGDWNILNNLRDNRTHREESGLPYTVHVETLTTNRRSLSRIIKFNNQLFQHIIQHLNETHKELTDEPCLSLQQAYSDVTQESPFKQEMGYVQVAMLQNSKASGEEESSYEQQTFMGLKQAVEQLLKLGEKPDDIAILVRKNRVIPEIADFFEQEMQLSVVSDEAFRLDASPAVQLLVAALRYLSNRTDEVALRTLVEGYHSLVLQDKSDFHLLMSGQPDELLPEGFAGHTEELRTLPLYELVERLYTLLGIERIENQDAYLFAFYDTLNEYLLEHASDMGEFLQCWDERLCGKTIACGALHGIRICSIHKSKGLEFKNVLIPFCDWKMENETNDQLVWCMPEETPFDHLPLVPVNYGSTMEDSAYRNDFLRERQQLWVDNVNLLYVALTRARERLFLFTEAKANTIGEMLIAAVLKMEEGRRGDVDGENIYFHYGEIDNVPVKKRAQAPSTDQTQQTTCPETDCVADRQQKAQAKAEVVPTEAPKMNRLAVTPQPLMVKMESLPHEVEFRQSNRSADFLAGKEDPEQSSTRFIDRGLLLHTLFSAITTPEEAPEAIDRLLFEGVIAPEEEEELRNFVNEALHLPQVQEWYDGSWRLFNECEILWMENGRLYSRRPDRVMMRHGEVVVVDFKFGQHRRHHHTQVKEYMHLLASMGYPTEQIRGYLWYVDNKSVSPVTFN